MVCFGLLVIYVGLFIGPTIEDLLVYKSKRLIKSGLILVGDVELMMGSPDGLDGVQLHVFTIVTYPFIS